MAQREAGRCVSRQTTSVESIAAPTNPAAAAHVSGEFSRVLFWIHEASGPIALGILTLAITAALLGYALTAIGWRFWLANKIRRRRNARLSRS